MCKRCTFLTFFVQTIVHNLFTSVQYAVENSQLLKDKAGELPSSELEGFMGPD